MVGAALAPKSTSQSARQNPAVPRRQGGVWRGLTRLAVATWRQLIIELRQRYGREEPVAFNRQPQRTAGALKLPQAEGAELDHQPIDQAVERVVAVELRRVPRPRAVGGEELHQRERIGLLRSRPKRGQGAPKRLGQQFHIMVELALLIIAS